MYFHIQIVKKQKRDTYYYSAAQSCNQSIILSILQAERVQHTQSIDQPINQRLQHNQSTNHSTPSDKSTKSINIAQSVN